MQRRSWTTHSTRMLSLARATEPLNLTLRCLEATLVIPHPSCRLATLIFLLRLPSHRPFYHLQIQMISVSDHLRLYSSARTFTLSISLHARTKDICYTHSMHTTLLSTAATRRSLSSHHTHSKSEHPIRRAPDPDHVGTQALEGLS